MVAAMMVSCAQLQAVPRAAKASFTSHKGSTRSRPQLRSRVVSMAAPKVILHNNSNVNDASSDKTRACGQQAAGLSSGSFVSKLLSPTSIETSASIAMQTAEEKSAIETAIDAAKETCESGTAGACATAWDEV